MKKGKNQITHSNVADEIKGESVLRTVSSIILDFNLRLGQSKTGNWKSEWQNKNTLLVFS